MDPTNNRLTRRRVLQIGALSFASAVLAACGNVVNSFTRGSAEPTSLPGAHNAVGAAPVTPADPNQVLITPNEDFYTVAIGNTSVPAPNDWKLTVGGNVDNARVFTLADLKQFPVVEEMRTFECISNPAGGPLISNAVWRGFKFSDLLKAVGARPNSLEVRFEAFDGFYTTIPLDLANDDHSFLVYEMNGMPLPVEHGAPLRAMWPGRYGMKQPKWLQKITLITDNQRGYWESQGWSNDAKILINSRIDSPEDNSTVKGDSVTVRGVAFSGREGIAKVEISFDEGKTWLTTKLVQAQGDIQSTVWTNWSWSGPIPGVGQYSIRARATSPQGNTQIQVAQDFFGSTFPNGTSDMQPVVVNFQKA